jgi:hypothetical protein
MYLQDSINITKTDDGGFLISCTVKRKKEEKKGKGDEKYPAVDIGGSDTKTVIAKTADEVAMKLKELLPKIEGGSVTVDDFNSCFDSAAKEKKEE